MLDTGTKNTVKGKSAAEIRNEIESAPLLEGLRKQLETRFALQHYAMRR